MHTLLLIIVSMAPPRIENSSFNQHVLETLVTRFVVECYYKLNSVGYWCD